MEKTLKQYYRPDEVCEILSINKTTFYRKVGDIENPLPAIRINKGGSLRVPIEDFQKWIEKNKVDPVNE